MELKQPSLLIATILFIFGLGVFYFLDLPQYNKDIIQQEQILTFTKQKAIKDDHTKRIAEIGIRLQTLNWDEKKKKIEPNFTSSPFFTPKMEKFFKDLVGRSGMTMGTLSFQGSSSAVAPITPTPAPAATSDTEGTGTKIKPTEQPASTTPVAKNQSGVIGIKGPVKKVGFTLTVSGSYEDLKKILDVFEKQAYLISVKSVGFSDAKGAQFTFNITGDIYSY